MSEISAGSGRMREPEVFRQPATSRKTSRMTGRGRVCCLSLSSLLAVFTLILLVICLFSADFRHNLDNTGGVKYFGLIRFCYEPKFGAHSRDDDSNSKTCHLRNYIHSSYCQDNNRFDGERSTRNCFGDFELAAVILVCTSIFLCILALSFAICTIFTSFGALAHSVVLIAAAICSCAAFLSYTYFYELKENQSEIIAGYQYLIHYGWAYYLLLAASFFQLVAFICSLFGTAMVLVHKNKRRNPKVRSIPL